MVKDGEDLTQTTNNETEKFRLNRDAAPLIYLYKRPCNWIIKHSLER